MIGRGAGCSASSVARSLTVNLGRTGISDVRRHIHTNLKQVGRPAEGAGHVRCQPRVDTAGMEHVTAVRNQLNRLPLTQLAQANRALVNHPVLRAPAVGHQRQRIHGGAVESAAAALAAGGGVRSGVDGGGEAADVDGEEAEEEERGEED